jgi:hypothetical protein
MSHELRANNFKLNISRFTFHVSRGERQKKLEGAINEFSGTDLDTAKFLGKTKLCTSTAL